jgi:GNAT superfamily N-acetyltransferase
MTADHFLHDATPRHLEAAVAENHHQWMVRKAEAAGGEVHQAEGVTWTYAGPKGEAMVLFPRLAPATASETLDAITRFYRERQPEPLVGCWSLDPPEPPDLEIRLLARGFQLGWQPRWLWLDLQKLNADHPRPPGLTVAPVEEIALWDAPHLPYYSRDTAALRHALTQPQPGTGEVGAWHFAAWLDGKPVGHSTLCVTTGPRGVGGLYDIGVVREARGQGIGKAVTLAACRQAQAVGCRHVLLNGTGERMYRQLGFVGLGYGLTWWLDARRLARRPPSAMQIALVEAVGRGDLDALATLAPRVTAATLNAPLTNDMTLPEIAAHTRQPTAADWLAAHGAKRADAEGDDRGDE